MPHSILINIGWRYYARSQNHLETLTFVQIGPRGEVESYRCAVLSQCPKFDQSITVKPENEYTFDQVFKALFGEPKRR